MSVLRINEILGRLNELRAVFVLGQRAIPFLEEIFSFLREISPLMDEINASLLDSTGQMPQARSQLESITQATELATTEIIDLIEGMQDLIRDARADTDRQLGEVAHLRQADAHLEDLLYHTLAGHHDALMATVAAHLRDRRPTYDGLEKHLNYQIDSLDLTRDSLNQILMSLQVQDITTQQIAAVNHLIENMRDRMNELTERLNNSLTFDDTALSFDLPDAPATFDPHARYDRATGQQRSADQIIADFQNGTLPIPVSREEIDKLFTHQDSIAPEAAAEQDPDEQRGEPPARTDDS